MKKQLILGSFLALSGIIYSQNSNPWPTNASVGIGTSAPSYKLDIRTSAGGNDGISITQNSWESAALHLTNNTTGGKHWALFSTGAGNGQGSGNFSILEYGSGIDRLFINGTSGNVGLSTNNPLAKLDVNGNINTNGVLTIGTRFTIDGVAGTFKNTAWAGTGNRLIVSDATGKITPLTQGASTQVLYGNGAWGNLAATAFVTSGSDLNLAAGKLGIGVATPVAALDVNGTAKFSEEVTASQGINIGNSTYFKSFTSPTPNVGKIITMGSAAGPGPGMDPSPCVIGTTPSWISAVSTGFYSSAGTAPNRAWLTMLASTTDGNAYIDASGSISGGAPAELYINQNCQSTTKINLAGGSVYIGDYVRMNKIVDIGPPGTGISTGFGAPAFNVNMQSGTGVEVKTSNNNVKAYSVINGNDYLFTVMADGKTQIGNSASVVNNGLLNINANNNSAIEVYNTVTAKTVFKVNGTGQTILNTNGITTTNDVFVVTNDPANINTANTNFKIKANGEVYCRYMKVSVNNFPDYVFAKDYNLPSLKEVEAYYTENKHLAEIPSASEIEKNGMDVGEINKLLVKKVEELTIYAVEQNKKTEAQQILLLELQKQIEALKK